MRPSAEFIPADLLALATPEEKAAYQLALEVRLAKTSPLEFACYASPATERYPHVEYLDAHLVALVEGHLYPSGIGPPPVGGLHPVTGEAPVDKMAVTEPPRHGKSYHVSDHTPGWYLSRWPHRWVALVSYEADFAATWGAKARSHLEAHPELGVKLDPRITSGRRWPTLQGGGMFTAGAQGAITGKGADLFIVDDPVKNAEEANSDVIREKIHQNYLTAAQTRLEPGAKIIVMMTRWHADDLMGRLLKDEPDQWYLLRLPAIAEEDDPIGRELGEALCPQRYPLPQLEKIRTSMGAQWFAAMYQGQPYIEGGGVFRQSTFRYWTDTKTHYRLESQEGAVKWVPKDECVRFMACDLAASTKSSADFTVFMTFDVTKDREVLLIHRTRSRMESPDHGPAAVRLWDELSPRWLLVEKQTFGLSLIQLIQRGHYGTRLIVKPVNADKDKVSRAIPAAAYMEMGKVYFPKGAPWLAELELELLEFDHGAHDDQVDTLVYGIQEVTQGALALGPKVIRVDEQHQTFQQRIDSQLDKKMRQRKGNRHPLLGRW